MSTSLEAIAILHEGSGCSVKRYPDNKVIKKGRRITLDEVPALELATQLQLPVPKVYAASKDPKAGECSIQMDFIAGERLDIVWPSLEESEKDGICQELREMLTKMRALPWKSGMIGSCSGGEVRDCRQYDTYTGGPFADETSFSSFYLDFVSTIPTPIRAALSSQIRSDHRIVFSHGDIAQHNCWFRRGSQNMAYHLSGKQYSLLV